MIDKSEYEYCPNYDCYLKASENPQIFMNPFAFIASKEGKGKISRTLLLGLLQNELHDLLSQFLHNSFLTRRGKLLFPMSDRFCGRHLKKHCDKLRLILQLLSEFNGNNYYKLIDALEQVENKKTVSPFAVAELISLLYQLFSKLLEKNNDKLQRVEISDFRIFDSYEYRSIDEHYFAPLIELKNYVTANLKEYLLGFYLHGSLATLDYVKGWSDVDALMILKKEVLLDATQLINIRRVIYSSIRYLYLIDPDQFHGYFIISEQDLTWYPQNYFPLVLFQFAKSFFDNPQILTFWVRSSLLERLNIFWSYCNYFRKAYFRDEIRDWVLHQGKYHLHALLLLPTLFLQVKGKHVYKKFSFAEVERHFKKEPFWEVVTQASKIRASWKRPIFISRQVEKGISKLRNPMMLPYFYRLFVKEKASFIGPAMIEKSVMLGDAMLSEIINDYEKLP